MKSISLIPQNKKRLIKAENNKKEDNMRTTEIKTTKINEKPIIHGSPKMQSRKHNNEQASVSTPSIHTISTQVKYENNSATLL